MLRRSKVCPENANINCHLAPPTPPEPSDRSPTRDPREDERRTTQLSPAQAAET